MAKFSLKPFNSSAAHPFSIESELNLTNESVFISYKLTGELSELDLGSGHPKHARVIKLWEKSCFELFIKNPEDSYMEFNFSPDFEWNAFYFAKKGDPLAEYKSIDAIKMDILLSLNVFHLIVEIDKKTFPAGFFDKQTTLSGAITSVIKEKNEFLSYWALNHTDTRPNFHDFRSFVKFN